MPSRPVTLLLVIALIVNLTACTTTRHIDPDTLDSANKPVIKEGGVATVIMVDGARNSGTVLEIEPDALVLGKAGNYGWDEQRLAWADIEYIEVNEATTFTNVMIVVTPVLLVAAVVTAAIVAGGIPVDSN